MVSLKLPPPIGRAVFENTMGNPCFTFLNTDPNAPHKKNCNYIVILKKPAFGINFGPLEVLELKMLSQSVVNISRKNTESRNTCKKSHLFKS